MSRVTGLYCKGRLEAKLDAFVAAKLTCCCGDKIVLRRHGCDFAYLPPRAGASGRATRGVTNPSDSGELSLGFSFACESVSQCFTNTLKR